MRRNAAALVLVILAISLILGITQLFQLRFESGDVYPPYSSLRSDPLGTMAFYESLERLPDLSVARDYSTSNRLPDSSGTAYLHLAASMEMWRHIPDIVFSEIDRFVNNGGRLVIALLPVPAEIILKRTEKESEEEKKNTEEESRSKVISVVDHWGLDSGIVSLKPDEESGFVPAQARNVTTLDLPATMAWHSGAVFSGLNAAWKPIFMRDTHPVVVERQIGRGSVVFASDSYFFSNEAMRNDRHSSLLAWIIGPGRQMVVFDEAHLGVTENPNFATLMGRYRLHWVIASFILLAALFVWKNSTSLLPIAEEERQRDFVFGKEAGEGFVNLLRRGIPARDLLSTCFTEWKKSSPHAGKHTAHRLREAETVVEAENSRTAKDRDPVRTYQTISNILHKRTP